MCIRPVGYYVPMVDLPDQDDPAIAKYLLQSSECDFFSPLLGLMQEAAGGRNSLDDQRKWILKVYGEIVKRSVKNGIGCRIALGSASSLIDLLTGLYNGRRYGSYYTIQYNTAYKIDQDHPVPKESQFEGAFSDDNLKELADVDCLEMGSVILAGAFPSNPQFREELKNHNPIPFFLYAWAVPDSVLWHKEAPKLREAVLKEGLCKVFPDRGDLYSAYLELFPVVFRLFDFAQEKRFALNTLPSEDEDFARSSQSCGDALCDRCIIL